MKQMPSRVYLQCEVKAKMTELLIILFELSKQHTCCEVKQVTSVRDHESLETPQEWIRGP